LGWPWDQIADAALRFTEADQRLWAAQVAIIGTERPDFNAIAAAQLDRDKAVADWHDVREDVARLWLAGFRFALELNPEAVETLRNPQRKADAAVASLYRELDAMRCRVRDLERQVASLTPGVGEPGVSR
jgi:hypothetical protein